MSEGAVIGIDFVAAFALGDALGLSKLAIAELLPSIEVSLVARVNERLEVNRGRS